MIIVENRVIFTGAKFNIQMAEDIDLNPPLNASSSTTKICKYWFDRFDGDAGYLKVTMAREDIKKNFGLDYYNGAKINDFIIKVHSNGITSTEIYFDINEEKMQICKFDNFLDDFSAKYSKKIFDLISKVNFELKSLQLIVFSSIYQYGVYVGKNKTIRNKVLSFLKRSNDEQSKIKDEQSDSYILRIHCFVANSNLFEKIQKYYDEISTPSKELVIPKFNSKVKLFWAFGLWQMDNLNHISDLMDIDSYTMNEIVIYQVATNTYTEEMFTISFQDSSSIHSSHLYEMYRVNSYFLQKNKLFELSFSEDVNCFVTNQREIEKFTMQMENFNSSEQKFLTTSNAVETNEKSNANRIIQYILTALTLLTIISVFKDIVEFIKAEFSNEEYALKIEFFSRSEFLTILLIVIIFLFLKLRQHINKV